ncbi:hypothetical protein YC2023_051835 [Brassica napus]
MLWHVAQPQVFVMFWQVTEIYNFTQDDLMTEDIFIVDCHPEIFVWVGQEVVPKNKLLALTIGEVRFIRHIANRTLERIKGDLDKVLNTLFVCLQMHGNSFQRKLKIVKNGGTPVADKPKRRTPASYGGRASVPEKSQQRSRTMSLSPDRVRVRGRSPAFNALAATFENQNARNLSTPPPVVRKLYPRSVTPDSARLAPKSAAIASRTFNPKIHQSVDLLSFVGHEASPKTPESPAPESSSKGKEEKKENDKEGEKSMSSKIVSLTIQADAKEGVVDEEDLPAYPYGRLKTTSPDPVTDIDVTRREAYLSSEEFKEKFGMTKEAFYKLPKWKQNKFKMAVQLF